MEELAVSLPDLAEQINEAHIIAGHAELRRIWGDRPLGSFYGKQKPELKRKQPAVGFHGSNSIVSFLDNKLPGT